jgi:polysaccharide biosynthesis PFTS motif protein
MDAFNQPKKFVKNEILDPSIWILISENLETQIDVLATHSWMNRSGFIHSIKGCSIFRKTMLWYSTNAEPIKFEGEIYKDQGIPVQAINCFNAHLVWNSHQASFLKRNGIGGVMVVGPIIFQSKIRKNKDPNVFAILFTDVTPTNDQSFFYNLQMSMSTLQAIVDVVEDLKRESGKDIRLYLKPKRGYSTFHSKVYVKYVKKLIKSKKIIFLDPDSNLYEVISKSSFLLSTPFTSTNFIAFDLEIPSAYFCQNFEPWILEDNHHDFEVITTKNRLKSTLEKSLVNS